MTALLEAELLKLISERAISAELHGRPMGPEGSIAKLVWSEAEQHVGEVAGAPLHLHLGLFGTCAGPSDVRIGGIERDHDRAALRERDRGSAAATTQVEDPLAAQVAEEAQLLICGSVVHVALTPRSQTSAPSRVPRRRGTAPRATS